MPIVEFDDSNKINNPQDFPKFKLEKDECARIVCLENPTYEWVHDLRAPKVINGKPSMETKRRRDGTEYQDYTMDFIGRPLCLGDLGIITDRGSDPKNCPICKAASNESDVANAPIRRFAMHIIRYGTRPGTFDLRENYNVEVLIWAFTERYFDKLRMLKNEWGNLQERDLTVKCTVQAYQNFDINAASKAEWLVNDERKQVTASTFKSDRTPDLTQFIGRKAQESWIEEDLQKIRDRWRIANGSQQVVPDLAQTATETAARSDLSAGLNDLLDGSSGNDAPAPSVDDLLHTAPARQSGHSEQAQESSDPMDVFKSESAPAESEPATASPVEAESVADDAAPAEPRNNGKTVSFDDLLNIGQ